MSQNKISVAFSGMSEAKFMETCRNIEGGMEDNPHFTELTDLITEYRTRLSAYENSIPEKNLRNQINVAQMNDQRALLMQTMRKLAYAVMSVADNNRTMLETSGFPLNTPSAKQTIIPNTPENLKVYITNTPDIIVGVCKADKHAKTYKMRVSEDQENWAWGNAGSTCKLFVSGLPKGVILYVQMATKNSLGQSTWSESERIRLPLPDEPELLRLNVNVML